METRTEPRRTKDAHYFHCHFNKYWHWTRTIAAVQLLFVRLSQSYNSYNGVFISIHKLFQFQFQHHLVFSFLCTFVVAWLPNTEKKKQKPIKHSNRSSVNVSDYVMLIFVLYNMLYVVMHIAHFLETDTFKVKKNWMKFVRIFPCDAYSNFIMTLLNISSKVFNGYFYNNIDCLIRTSILWLDSIRIIFIVFENKNILCGTTTP